jgi:hypothetical protein
MKARPLTAQEMALPIRIKVRRDKTKMYTSGTTSSPGTETGGSRNEPNNTVTFSGDFYEEKISVRSNSINSRTCI